MDYVSERLKQKPFQFEEREDLLFTPGLALLLDYGVDLVRQVLMPKTVHAGQYPTVPVSKATIPTTLNVAVPQVERSRNNAPNNKYPPTTNRITFSVPPTFLSMWSSFFTGCVYDT
jgi:hypothetical protein